MEKFILLKQYADLVSAEEAENILRENNISYKIEDQNLQFKFDKTGYDFIKLKVPEKDFKRAEEILNRHEENKITDLGKDHYLYTFSDSDIIDIVANQEEWTNAEIKLAQKIIQERGIIISENIIESKQNEHTKRKIEEITKNNNSAWFLIIAILTALNTIIFYSEIKIRFIFGLGFTEIIERLFLKSDYIFIPLIANIIFIGFFIFIWLHARKNHEWAFITGLIIYLFDTIYLLFLGYWFGSLIHIIISIFIFLAYKKTKKQLYKIKKTN